MSDIDALLSQAVADTCFTTDWFFNFEGVPHYCEKHKEYLERYADMNGEIFFSCSQGLQLWNGNGLEFKPF